ncbi:MAG: hypothetical protein LBR82_09650 [Desulfovibrio sp.]|jgi:hypothetical protein|nr:hypothetical protein [Desulfovibrio sp.]
MGIIYQKDKRVGITYAYENESYPDKDKQQPRSRRKLIGRVDEATGKIVPTRERKPAQKEPTSKRAYANCRYRLPGIQKKSSSQWIAASTAETM